jgi:RecB family exonuclease
MALSKRSRNLYDPASTKPFKLSRSRLENFIKCPRCFYLDRRLGIDRPSMPGFTLNTAVDHLFKKEFDSYREKSEPHPLMKKFGLDAIPFAHPNLNIWRENFKGLQYHHKLTNFIVTGAVDDLWVNPAGQLMVVDYKSTSKDGAVTLDDQWKEAYKRQMEIYQWILRNMGFDVLDMGYFVYANGRKDFEAFNGTLNFHVEIILYQGNAAWVEEALIKASDCLRSAKIPEGKDDCEFCMYRKLTVEAEG